MSSIQLRHEFSLCRVYVISGSFRAFDRRPLEVTGDPQHQGDGAGPSAQNTTMVEKAGSLSETSSSGDLADPPGASGSNTDWEMNDDLEQTFLELDELKWP